MSHVTTRNEAKPPRAEPVDRAAAGEGAAIAKNGSPQARLVPIAILGKPREPANIMRIRRIGAEFDAPDAAIEARFGGPEA